jgi:hypothetical protein
LNLTQKEAERLRKIGDARRRKAGMGTPGSAGLMADRPGSPSKRVGNGVTKGVEMEAAGVEAAR